MLPVAMTTGHGLLDEIINWVTVFIILPTMYWVWRKLVQKGREAARNWTLIQENKQELEKLKAELKDHIQKDAVEAAVIFGFIDVGEEAHIVWDIDGKVVFPSPAFCKMVGVDTSEMVNGAWKEIIHPEDSQRVLKEWNTFIQGNSPTARLKFRFYKEGSLSGRSPEILVSLKMVRKKVATGGVIRIVGLFKRLEDISQTKEHHLDETPIGPTKSSSS